MREFSSFSSNEIVKPSTLDTGSFDPDKRIDVNRQTDIKSQTGYDVDKRVVVNDKIGVFEAGIPDTFYTSWEQRESCFPIDGEWQGEVGNSKFISNNSETNVELAKYGLNGIEYKNGVPDFSKCSLLNCKIEHMTPDKETNLKNFSKELVDKGEFSNKREVLDFKHKNGLAFHECSDTHTCQFVPTKIHQTFTHTGGRLECKIRDIAEGNGGTKFDD